MNELLTRPEPTADHRLPYGADLAQFGELWLPKTIGDVLLPVIVFFHGGWWKSKYNLSYGNHLCASLKNEGIVVWSVEYRRVGSTGGGWPHTFQDAANGSDFINTLAKSFPLDLKRVITMGHSAGGHLAFWVAGRHHVEHAANLKILGIDRPTVPLIGAIGLAGAVDLRLTIDLAGNGLFAHDKQEVHNLMNGMPFDVPDRYKIANPGDLLPFHVPQVLIQGSEDDQIPPELPVRWTAMATRQGDLASYVIVAGADHFDVVDPTSKAWETVRQTVLRMLGSKGVPVNR